MKLTFRHRFTDGRRAVMTMRGANGRPRIQWPDGMPTALQEAANHYGRQILYVLPYDDCTVVASICPTTP